VNPRLRESWGLRYGDDATQVRMKPGITKKLAQGNQ
jgi:hypothetical protein